MNHQGDVSAIRLQDRLPRHLHILSVACFEEAQVDDAATDPGDEARGVGQIDKPVEDDRARATTVEVSEGAEEGGDTDDVVRPPCFEHVLKMHGAEPWTVRE